MTTPEQGTPRAFLRWSCNSCSKEAETPLANPPIEHKDAPAGWVRLGVLTRDESPFGFRWLCDDCAGFIRRELPNALGLSPLEASRSAS